MAYPPKTDPQNPTWVIAFDIKMDRLKKYCEEHSENEEQCKNDLKLYRTQIFNEIYLVLGNYDFKWRMQNSLAFNNSNDATKAFKAISLGLKKSWAKYFIEKLHIFEIDPNSDARDLLELDIEAKNSPKWLTDDILNFIQISEDESYSDDF